VKQLFLKGLDDDAMALVAEGREQGLKPDSDLCEPILRNLCAAGLKEQAYVQLDTMAQVGGREAGPGRATVAHSCAASWCA
jgi:hypothetical protein